MDDVDFVEKIHIAAYWRKQLGEYEYVNYNADDLRRWYIALETRGPDDIRSTLRERASRYPVHVLTGLVSLAPHPPLSIVELWLASREHTSAKPYWTALLAFCLLGYVAATNLQGCATLVDPNTLVSQPPQMNAPVQSGTFGQLPPALATNPNPGPPPANVASPTAGTTSSQHN